MPSTENGNCFYITSYKADDEDRIANELKNVQELLIVTMNEVNKQYDDEVSE